ncbi:MAG: hypothetical protein AAF629_29580 [Chloroflexota bacterium]
MLLMNGLLSDARYTISGSDSGCYEDILKRDEHRDISEALSTLEPPYMITFLAVDQVPLPVQSQFSEGTECGLMVYPPDCVAPYFVTTSKAQ